MAIPLFFLSELKKKQVVVASVLYNWLVMCVLVTFF